jgi:HAD superfamily hydrolase (TIGR01549 family)
MKTHDPIEIITFDFFGVLCAPMYGGLLHDLFPDNPTAWRKWMDIVEFEVDIGTVTEDAFIELLSKECGIPVKELKDRSYQYAKLNESLLDIIADLKHYYRIGLLTNAPRSIIEGALKDKIDLFTTILISGDVGIIKPHAEIYEQFIKACELPADRIFFTDDNVRNVAAARVSGIIATQYIDIPQFLRDMEHEGVVFPRYQTLGSF